MGQDNQLRGFIRPEEFEDLEKFLDKNSSTQTFNIHVALDEYVGINEWLVHVTFQQGITIIKVEPLAIDIERTNDKYSGLSKLLETIQSSAKISFPDPRSDKLLRGLDPIQNYRQVAVPPLPDMEGWWMKTIQDESQLTTYLNRGGLLRLSMRLFDNPELDFDEFAWKVNRYQPGDGQTMVRLYKWYDDTTLDLNEWNRSWQARYTLIGRTGSRACGFCLPFPGDRIGLKPTLGIIGEIYVEPVHRRKGLGGKFITQAIGELSDLSEIRTGTTLPNPATYNLLKKTGFVTESVTPKETYSLYTLGPE